ARPGANADEARIGRTTLSQLRRRGNRREHIRIPAVIDTVSIGSIPPACRQDGNAWHQAGDRKYGQCSPPLVMKFADFAFGKLKPRRIFRAKEEAFIAIRLRILAQGSVVELAVQASDRLR